METHLAILPTVILQNSPAPSDAEGSSPLKDDLRFLRVPHPRTGLPSLFLPLEEPRSTLFEVQSITLPNPRSWFMNEEVISDGKLLLITATDPAYLLLSIIMGTVPSDGSLGNFRPADDIFEDALNKIQESIAATSDVDIAAVASEDVLQLLSLSCVRDALPSICEVKEITPEIVVYRYCSTKTLQYLRKKVTRLANSKVVESCRTITRGLAKDGLMEDGKDNLLTLGRIKVACDLVSQYLPPLIRAALVESYDFAELDAHLNSLDKFAEVEPIKEQGNKVTPAVFGEEKKRKTVKGSHGVEKLKKVNVNGMAKLSSFFKKTERS